MTRDALKDYLAKKFGDKLSLLETGKHNPLYEVRTTDLVEVCRALKEDESLKYDYLLNIGAVDTGERFEAVYSLDSVSHTAPRLDIKVILDRDKPTLDSVQELWPGANWFEREMWELYGYHINNHDNLTRFLLPDDWNQGHPMRKDWDAPDFVRMPEL